MACRKARFGLFRSDSGYDRVAPTFPRLDGQRFSLPRGPRPRESGSPPTIAGSARATTSPSIDRERGVPGRAFIQRKVILVQEIVVPTENPIRVKAFEISDSQEDEETEASRVRRSKRNIVTSRWNPEESWAK